MISVSAVVFAASTAAVGLTALLLRHDRLALLPSSGWLRVVSPLAMKLLGMTALATAIAILISAIAGAAGPVVALAGLVVAWLLTGAVIVSILLDRSWVTAAAATLMFVSAVPVWGWFILHPRLHRYSHRLRVRL